MLDFLQKALNPEIVETILCFTDEEIDRIDIMAAACEHDDVGNIFDTSVALVEFISTSKSEGKEFAIFRIEDDMIYIKGEFPPPAVAQRMQALLRAPLSILQTFSISCPAVSEYDTRTSLSNLNHHTLNDNMRHAILILEEGMALAAEGWKIGVKEPEGKVYDALELEEFEIAARSKTYRRYPILGQSQE